ncbi:MAG TPA: MEDS domain-containing protein [Acidimicrobiales bacterium]|nr:MEDS domain-containing protein [Acidimicrobiales bacterium]
MQVDDGRHACCYYDDDAQRDVVVGQFLADGVARHQRLLYLSDGTAPEVVARLLDARGIDSAALLRSGGLAVEPAATAYLAGGTFDPDDVKDLVRVRVHDALAAGYAGLRVTAEMGWATRGAPGTERLDEYERDVNALFDEGSLVGLCQYDRRVFDSAAVALACHHEVCGSAGFVASRRNGTMRVAGEVDFNDSDVLAACIAAGDLDVDLADVAFVDIAAVRALVSAARRLPAGAALVLRNVPPVVERLLALTGWGATPQLRAEVRLAR